MEINTTLFRKAPRFGTRLCKVEKILELSGSDVVYLKKSCGRIRLSLIVKAVVSKNIYFLFLQVIRYCSVPDVSINKLSTFIGNHVRHRILPDHHHFG